MAHLGHFHVGVRYQPILIDEDGGSSCEDGKVRQEDGGCEKHF